uniref:Uncharacterized protein n=1 Tax=Tanacetum cinerariifolium TaxID=118510 RepID=A0A699GJS8_TANCI|nr:hypothetical protein [Tanacetum cinerariifolium]
MVNATKESFDEDDLAKFQELLLDAEKPLYKGCPDFTKLSVIVKLLNLKDSQAWRTINEKFPEIAKDLRNLRLGISADRVDVNSGTRHHSVWPVLSVIYNLPLWLCMKRKFIMLSVLISVYPGNDIDVFLEPLVDDLHTLFETGVDTYDTSTKEKFNLRAVMLWMINDYPALDDIYHTTIRSEGKKGVWTTRILACSKSIDQETNIQQEKNVCESLIKTLLNDPGKTKDGMIARLDLAELGIKPELFARQEEDKTTLPPAGRPEGCIAEETIVEETIEFFSEYHKTMKTIGIPPDKHVTNENKDEKPLLAGKSSEVSREVFQKAHLYVIHNTDEIVPYIERHKQVLKTKNPGKRIALLENKHSKSFAKWLREEVIYTCNEIQVERERELAISKYSVSETVSGVSVEAVDLHISKEFSTTRKAFYYEVLQEIWVLDYRFRQIPFFKCDWVNHKAGEVKHYPNLGYTSVDLNSLGHKDDLFILASQARQVFYVKDQIDKKLSIVFRTPTKNYKDTYDEVDEEFSTVIHEHNDNILPHVNRRDLGNESQNDYYQTDCEGIAIQKSKPVSVVVPKIMVTRPRLAHPIVTKSKSPIRRHITRSPSLKTSNLPHRVTANKALVVSVAQGVQGTWGNPQYALKDKGVIDSGCSRHMTGNMSYLFDFEELNGGYVSFGGNPKGGKISGKGKIKTGKLDFEDVYFVKELKFNLFSVSQMCDKKISVLFTDTKCLVFSFDFKLLDESQVLLRVPTENNMYNVNLKNIVPSGDLTCLFAKGSTSGIRASRETLKGLHKGYDRFQSLLSQLETHSASVSTEDANQKFLRSIPSSWSQVSFIMRTKPGVDTLSYDDLYNNIRVFEYDVKGSTGSSSSIHNVAFVSSDNTSSTNEVNTAYDHEDLKQLDEFDLEEIDLKWQVTMISIRLKKFYKKIGRKLHFDATEPIGFEKNKVECFNCHNTWHFAKECKSKGNQNSRRRDAGNTRHKSKDNERRPAKQDEHKAMVTIDGEGVDWTGHAVDDTKDYALMAFNSSHSGSDTEVTSCSKECENTYAKIKKLYNEQREQISVDSIEIQAYTLALKKKLLAEAEKEKEELKTKLENFQNSSKGLSKLLNCQMSAKDKSKLGNGTQIHEGVLSYENEVLESVFNSRPSDIEDSRVNDRFSKVKGMHAVPPLMTGNYMPLKSDFRIDESKFSYGPKQSKNSKFDAKTTDFATCDSNSSLETLESVPKQVESKPKAVGKPKVWSDAPIIEEYKSNSDDENVSTAIVEQETPSCASINTVQHVKSPRQTVKDQDTCSQNPKVDKKYLTGLMSKDRDNPHQTLKGKCIIDSRCSRHMTRNKAYLVEYQDFNGGPVAFGGLKEANNNVGTQDNLNAVNSKMEAEHVTEYFVLPLWSSYTSTVKYSKAKNGDEKLNEDTGSKTNKEPVDQEGTARASSTNYVNTTSIPFNTASLSRNVDAMQEELLQFKTQQVWILADLPFGKKVIRIKWVYRNKKDEKGVVVINKSRLVAQGHRKEEGIDYDEVFALVARLEAIKIFLAFASYMGLTVYQMDVKSSFSYGKIDEDVYVSQPPGFIDPKFRKKVYKVVKALYGLHQAPRDWYATLSTFLVKSRYKRGIIDKTLFINKDQKDIMLDKYVAEILKKFDFMSAKTASTLIETKKPLVKDAKAVDVDVHLYRSMIGSLMYLTTSRHDIMYAVCACFRFQVTPKTSHLHAVKRIFRKSITGGDFNKLDDLVGKGADYVVNDGRSTDKIKVLNAKAEGVSAAGETLSTATLAVSTVSVQPILLCSFKNQEAKMGKELASTKQTAFGKDFLNPLMDNSLPKTIWLSMHHVIAMRYWLFQSERLLVDPHRFEGYSNQTQIIYKWDSDNETEIPKMEPYVEVTLQAPPPSSDYVSGPEHPPPSPYYTPGPEEPRAPLLPDFPYATDASPMTLSLGYIVDTDLEEDEDEEDPEEDPADRGDDDDDDESSNDDDDDNNEEDEEEHPAPAGSTAITFLADHALSAKETVPFETDESVLTLRSPPPTYHVKARMSI